MGGVSAPGGVVASQTPLHRRQVWWILVPRWRVLMSQLLTGLLISNLHFSALVCVLCVKASAFFMEYRLVVYVLFVSVWHRRWTLTAKSVALRFSKTSSVGRFSVAVVDRFSGSLGSAYIPALQRINCYCAVVQHFLSLQVSRLQVEGLVALTTRLLLGSHYFRSRS
ncbi:hypothetical protein DY000_02023996 [Brassica cretica]|uniref:Uncharacterized protein n=1 Tax=Brassica cretica TaxID=69181 RepID=A0ABQ7E9W1_BRACR|nr:hypothetical protein DY000_02023996 [Brassica cretica]